MKTADIIIEQVKALPDSLAREVLDFIGYLKQRGERLETNNLIDAQQISLNNIWADEPEDIWNA